jgi:hypothetical protein
VLAAGSFLGGIFRGCCQWVSEGEELSVRERRKKLLQCQLGNWK